MIIAAKAPGVPAVPDQSGDVSVIAMIGAATDQRLYPVHRIDRPVSGLVVYARTGRTARLLSDQFRLSTAERRYWAIVQNELSPPAGRLIHRIAVDRRRNMSRVVTTGGQKAELTYAVAGKSDRYFLVDIALVTGRHHQIRVQLASVGCPIRGDLKYGARRSVPGGGIGLHARQLSLKHPGTNVRITVDTPPPADRLWQALTADR